MDADPPLKRIVAASRQVDTSTLDPKKHSVFRCCFPFFEDPSDLDEEPELHSDAAKQPLDEKFRSSRRSRRYAGDVLSFFRRSEWDLPRGRYYALTSADGNDYGVLASELRTYAHPSGIAGVVDGYNLHAMRQLGFEERQERIYVGIKSDSPLFPAIARFMNAEKSLDMAKERRGSVFTLEFPTVATKLEISNVLDLRRPSARDWLFSTFRSGFHELTGITEALKGDSFYHMLPALMCTVRGGSYLTQAIGLLLRRCGVDALIYPSARYDVRVVVQNGEPIDWQGWHLVRYTGAPLPKLPGEVGAVIYSINSEAEEPRGLISDVEKAKTDLASWGSLKHATVFATPDSLWSPPGIPQQLSYRGASKGVQAGSFEVYNYVDRQLHLPPSEH